MIVDGDSSLSPDRASPSFSSDSSAPARISSGSSSPIRHRSITFCALKISLRSVALSLTMRM